MTQSRPGSTRNPRSISARRNVAQLIEALIAKIEKETLEQSILRGWPKEMPTPHESNRQVNEKVCGRLPVIDQAEFFRTIFELNNNIVYTVRSGEDFLSSRSHFSPYLADPSRRDGYLIRITESLLMRIKEEAYNNKSKFLVFYPIREDIDKRGMQMVKCVANSQGNAFRVSLDAKSLLQKILSSNDLEIFDLPGGNEIVVSRDDRHLNDLGNEQVMEHLALRLTERSIFDR